MLTFQNFSKSYGNTCILQLDELHISAGIHWIKGSNGSGKTTLFKVLAGLLPYQGEISLDNIPLNQDSVLHRRWVNYGEAEPLYPEFITGQELVKLFAKAKRAPSTQVDQLIDCLGVAPYLYKPTGTYSSGMLKKLSVLLAFLGTPKLVLLDEPLITLDVATVQSVYTLIGEYYAQGTSFLLTSHQDIEMPGLPLTATWQVLQQSLTLLPA